VSKRYGCPKCGNVKDFREINVALADYNFGHFEPPDAEHPNPRVLDCDDTSVDYEGAEPIARGRYQCKDDDCQQFFDEPAEIDENRKPVEGTGKPVADEDVIRRSDEP
jgi:hypothetical protein